MGTLTKKYRLFWITDTKEILNDYRQNYLNSTTTYPDQSPNTYFESDAYADITNKIASEQLRDRKGNPPLR